METTKKIKTIKERKIYNISFKVNETEKNEMDYMMKKLGVKNRSEKILSVLLTTLKKEIEEIDSSDNIISTMKNLFDFKNNTDKKKGEI